MQFDFIVVVYFETPEQHTVYRALVWTCFGDCGGLEIPDGIVSDIGRAVTQYSVGQRRRGATGCHIGRGGISVIIAVPAILPARNAVYTPLILSLPLVVSRPRGDR